NPGVRVLLLEEGGEANWLSLMPKGYGKLLGMPNFSHYYQTTPAEGARGPTETWMRGRMVGGSSAINGMVWIRGTAEDFDFISAAGNSGWNWSKMLRCYRAMENHHLGADEFRGGSGPVAIKTNPDKSPLADAFIAAGVETGLKVKKDQNGAEQEGTGYAQWNIDARGRRVSAARAFLDPARTRANLEIRSGVRVHRVLFENNRAVGVSATENGQPVEFRTVGEVILSAGAIITPKLLQLSGIGDSAKLSALGIDVVHHSPFVGQRMREHLTLAISFRLKHWRDSDNREYSGARLYWNVLKYLVAGKGPLARGAAEAIAFVRARPGSNRPDSQIMFNPYSMDPNLTTIAFESEPGMQCYSFTLRPESEGSAQITSADPDAPMHINPNYLATERDRETSIAGTRALRAIMAQPSMKKFVVGETAKTAGAQTDEEILGLYAQYGHSGFHTVGTAGMGPGAEDVVDDHLRVRGVDGLRVVDCSVFQQVPSGNTNAPAMALGWRASEIILEDAG
ncbi:MAG: GMC family oxidoreductase N-terminal domain-containing protein, partial [Sphingobium sp.]